MYTEKQEYTYKTLWTDVNKNNEIHKHRRKHKLKKDKILKSALSLFLNEHMDVSSMHSFVRLFQSWVPLNVNEFLKKIVFAPLSGKDA